jgi:hypothetical protein
MFRREIIQSVVLQENRFGFEPEVTAKIAERRCRVYEVGISYSGRTYEEGKKIGWRDGFRAIWCIVKYRPRRRRLSEATPHRLVPDGTIAGALIAHPEQQPRAVSDPTHTRS